jgi:hypothetical protein
MIEDPVKIAPEGIAKTFQLGVEFRHDWKTRGEQRIAHTEFADGNARTYRTCNHCGLVKITVHFAGGGKVERRWRRAGWAEEWSIENTPPCPGPKLRAGD